MVKKSLLFLACIFSAAAIHAQNMLTVEGTVKEDKSKLTGATVYLKKDGKTVEQMTTTSNGKFLFDVPLDGNYMVVFTKDGYVSKKVSVNTNDVPDQQKLDRHEFPMDVALFQEIEGVNISILKNPIGKILYNTRQGYFDYDEAYTRGIQAELAKLQRELEKKMEEEREYKELISQADRQFNKGEYDDARKDYEKAQKVKPKAPYPKEKITEIDKLLGAEEKYNTAIASADDAFKNEQYNEAKSKFQEAANLKPTEQYPKDKIAEIDKLLAEKKQQEAELAAKQKQYDEAIAKANTQFNQKEYEQAKATYQQAAGIKPEEDLPKNKIAEIDGILAKLAKEKEEEEKKEAAYKDAIAKADGFFKSEDFETARKNYEQALVIKPGEEYPKNQMLEIDKRLKEIELAKAEAEKNEVAYKEAIGRAEYALKEENYSAAKSEFEKAVGIKPDQQYPKDEITKIDKKLAELAALEKQKEEYRVALAKADEAFNGKDYENAKSLYNAALEIKNDEQYPKDKIAEIETILAELAKEQAEKEAKEKAYAEAIKAGDGAFGSKDYENAKSKYQEAASLKPEETYPAEKIKEIEDLLAALAKEEAEKAKQEEAYNNVIAKADEAFSAENYDEAKSKYNAALEIKSEEQYPKDKLAEIENKLAELAKAEAEQKEKDEAYQSAIAKADEELASENYEAAKAKYNEALAIKGDEQYPKDKLTEIDQILQELAARKAAEEAANKAYQEALAKADKAFSDKEYENAKGLYQAALEQKPEEQYPKGKIEEIDNLLAKLAQEEEEKAKQEEAYNGAIAKADEAFQGEDYGAAKEGYKEALAIKPAEEYPAGQIAEIDKILQAQLQAQEKDEQYQTLITQADGQLTNEQYNEAKATYEQALGVKPDETYPKEKIEEIQNILNQLAQEKAKQEEQDQAYAVAITDGDNAFNAGNYDEAKTAYEKAQNIKSDEEYPTTKLAEIEEKLAELAAAEEAKAAELAAEEEAKRKAEEEAKLAAEKAAEEEAKRKAEDEARAAELAAEEEAKRKAEEEAKLAAEKAAEEEAQRKAEEEARAAELAAEEEAKRKAEEEAKLAAEKAAEEEAKRKAEEEARLAAEKQAEEEKKEKYNAFIASADKAFKDNDFETAKENYQEALNVIPEETYPSDQLAKIEEKQAKLAAAAAKKKEEMEAKRKAEAEKKKQAELAKAKERQEEYKSIIAKADKEFDDKNYKQAAIDYELALKLVPDAEHPKKRLEELQKIADDLAKKAKEQEEENKKAVKGLGDNGEVKAAEKAKKGSTRSRSTY